jgi:hypothetical protein
MLLIIPAALPRDQLVDADSHRLHGVQRRAPESVVQQWDGPLCHVVLPGHVPAGSSTRWYVAVGVSSGCCGTCTIQPCVHRGAQTVRRCDAGIATSRYPDGPFGYRRMFYPDGNETIDFTVFQDDDGQAFIARTYYNNQTYVAHCGGVCRCGQRVIDVCRVRCCTGIGFPAASCSRCGSL